MRVAVVIGVLAVVTSLVVSPAQAQLIDFQPIFDAVETIRGEAIAAKNNALNAVNRAIEARDRATEVRNTMQEGVQTLTTQIREAIADAIDDLKDGIQEEIDGLNEFSPGGGCSGPCAQFRADLIRLLRNSDGLMEALLFAGGVDDPLVDSSRLIRLIELVPGRVLFPLYRLFAVETNMFGPGGLVDRLGDAVQHVVLMAQALPEPPSALRLAASATPSLLDDELAACSFVLENLRPLKTATSLLSGNAVVLKVIGAGLSATGETHLQKNAAIWGWAGVTLQNNRAKKLGTGLQGAGAAMSALSGAISTKVSHCALVRIQADARDRDNAILQILSDAQKIKF